MLKTKFTKHVPLPKETPAFFCGNCGVVSLNAANICKPQGKLKKVDWCGSRDMFKAKLCKNRVNNNSYRCTNCGKAAINSALLCETKKIPMPDKVKIDKNLGSGVVCKLEGFGVMRKN